jgi:hypothetical protein
MQRHSRMMRHCKGGAQTTHAFRAATLTSTSEIELKTLPPPPLTKSEADISATKAAAAEAGI